MIGVIGVVLLYLSVQFSSFFTCSGPAGARSGGYTRVGGDACGVGTKEGAALIAVGIAVSALGFLSQSILTAPRVYFAMAETDYLPARWAGWISGDAYPWWRLPSRESLRLSSRFPAATIESSSYVLSMDFLFFGLNNDCAYLRFAAVISKMAAKLPKKAWPECRGIP